MLCVLIYLILFVNSALLFNNISEGCGRLSLYLDYGLFVWLVRDCLRWFLVVWNSVAWRDMVMDGYGFCGMLWVFPALLFSFLKMIQRLFDFV